MPNRSTSIIFPVTACIAAALCLVAPAQAVVHTVSNQSELNLAVSSLVSGDKIVFVNNATLQGPINIVGLQDITLVMAEDPTRVGAGTVGISGFNFTNGLSARISALGSSCISISSSERVRIVGLRLRCGTGIHVQNSLDVQILGNKFFVTGVGVQLENSAGSFVASNRIQQHGLTPSMSYGIGVIGGIDNLLFDNEIHDALDVGLWVDSTAGRTASVNNLVVLAGATPVIGIQDAGQQSCLLRNEADGDMHPFRIGCAPATLIGNSRPSTTSSFFCSPTTPPPPFENNL